MMKSVKTCTGQDLRGMFATATRGLEKNAQAINLMNVFPVPDGDTGTNMLLTMRATMEEAHRCQEQSVSAVARAMARGALMGARGNSGVILSQILRGLAHGLDSRDSFDGCQLAAALTEASTMAYKGVSRPVEGTILTVIREVAAAAQAAAATNNHNIVAIMEATVQAAKESVAHTPDLLPVLREAGVVDAGGQGLYIVLEGSLRYLRGEAEADWEILPVDNGMLRRQSAALATDKPTYGYCTEFLLEGKDLDLAQIRQKLEDLGDSVMVVGDGVAVRVHLHTFDPGAAISYGTSLGALRQVKVDNMRNQHQDLLAAQPGKPPVPRGEVSTIAVVSGEGLMRVFASLGASVIVHGGETMNPSVRELLQAVESAPCDKVIVLPNNPNIIMTAQQVRNIIPKKVVVLKAETIPQGIAALLSFNCEADLDANVEAMSRALTAVRSGEVTTAVQSRAMHGIKVKEGQTIGFIDGNLEVAGDSRIEVLQDLLPRMDIDNAELVTLYYGADTGQHEAEQLAGALRQKYPNCQIELVFGGQPHYNYLVSVE